MPDINGLEFVLLAILALVILGPEKLPGYAADAARLVRQVRRMARDAKDEVRSSLGPEFQDIDLDDLNPRRFARKHLGLDDDDLDLGLDGFDDATPAPPRTPRQRRAAAMDAADAAAAEAGRAGSDAREATGSTALPEQAPPQRAPYDPDAT